MSRREDIVEFLQSIAVLAVDAQRPTLDPEEIAEAIEDIRADLDKAAKLVELERRELLDDVFKIRLSDAVFSILQIDATDRDRNVTYTGNVVQGDYAAFDRIADELESVAAGLLCDATDNPGATKRAALAGAIKIRNAIGPKCGHSACRQNWIDTGKAECVECTCETLQGGLPSALTGPARFFLERLSAWEITGFEQMCSPEMWSELLGAGFVQWDVGIGPTITDAGRAGLKDGAK